MVMETITGDPAVAIGEAPVRHVEFRIFGPPGTGKTTRLRREIERAARRFGSDRVLVASFSKAAARHLLELDLPVDQAHVGTLHALCYRLLSASGSGRPDIAEKKLKDWNDWCAEKRRLRLSAEVTKNSLDEPHTEYTPQTDGDRDFQTYNLLRARLTPRTMWPVRIRAFAEHWEAWKRQRGFIDFTDMIDEVYRGDIAPPGQPAVGFFDEVQDFTALELAVVRQWAGRMEYTVLAGDDDQTIYAFKGAEPQAFLLPDIPAAYKRVLPQSYRVPAAVHRLAERWIRAVAVREPKTYLPRDEEGQVRRLTSATWKYPEEWLGTVQASLDTGKTVMVLTSCAYMLEPALALLRRHGVPFHNPYRPTRGDWNPLIRGSEKKVTATDRVLAYLRPDGDTWGELAGRWTGVDLARWTEPLTVEKTLTHGAKAAIARLPAGEVVPITQLATWFQPAALAPALELSLDWYRGAVLPTSGKALQFPIAIAKRSGGAQLRETPRLVIGTIHSVKGAEADVVLIFPDLSPSGFVEWSHPGDGRDAVRRQFYVGITRAKETLIIGGPSSALCVEL